MHPDLYLLVERVRAQELRAKAAHHRLATHRPASNSVIALWERRLGWALVETGLRLLSRRTPDGLHLLNRRA
jgi:hypothetical protein